MKYGPKRYAIYEINAMGCHAQYAINVNDDHSAENLHEKGLKVVQISDGFTAALLGHPILVKLLTPVDVDNIAKALAEGNLKQKETLDGRVRFIKPE